MRLRLILSVLLASVLGLAVLPPMAAAAPGDDSPFTRLNGFVPSGEKVRVRPEAYVATRVDLTALRAALPSGEASAVVSIPAPEGKAQRFRVTRTQLMESELAAAHPEVATYSGVGLDDTTATIALDITPMGFHASVRGAGGQRAWYVDPAYNRRGTTTHLSYYGAALPKAEQRRLEGETKAIRSSIAELGPGQPVERRFYRLALTSDPSYAEYFGTENVLAEKITLINRVNQIYNDDLAVQLRLVNGTDLLNLDTEAKATGPDGPCGAAPCFLPQTSTTDGELDYCDVPGLGKNRTVLGQLIGASNYDVGHLALGVDGGGIAYLGVVGGDYKGGGCTGLPEPKGDFFAIDYVAHEIGHQFGGDHTFNGALGACGGNIGEPAVEPGSGSSVMAYAGICGQDDLQPHTDPYFSFKTVDQVQDVMTSAPYGNVEVQTVSLRGFGADGDSFRLSYDGDTSDPITLGDNYSAAGIKAVIEDLTGETVSIAQWGFDEFTYDPEVLEPDETGFQVIFNDEPSILAGSEDLPALDVVDPSAGVSGFVGETARGGDSQNGGDLVGSTNANPTVTAPADKTIPVRTPFSLTGSGTDPDGDSLVYLWEQTDFGTGVRLAQNARTTGPLFRVFGQAAEVTDEGSLQSPSPGQNLADGSPTRVFPDLDQILAGNTNAAAPCPTPTTPVNQMLPLPLRDCYSELLPTSSYTGSADNSGPPAMVFRLTARDRFVNGGGLAFDDVRLTVDPSAGPFLVTSQASAATLTGGTSVPVTWAVNGTQALAANVRISLLVDGVDTVLVPSTANDGSESVTIPNQAVSGARIKISAVDNYFFDLSDADLTVKVGDTTVPDTTITGGPTAFTLSPVAAFGLSSTVPGSTFACTLDGAPVACDAAGLGVSVAVGTHTVTAAATSPTGVTDPTPATRTWAVPLDDRALKAKGWKAKKTKKAYLGTYLKGSKSWLEATLKVSDATKIALVVGQGKGFGKVQVFLGQKKLGTVNLSAKKTKYAVLVKVATLSKPTSGTLRIVTTSSKKVVVDGVGVLAP